MKVLFDIVVTLFAAEVLEREIVIKVLEPVPATLYVIPLKVLL